MNVSNSAALARQVTPGWRAVEDRLNARRSARERFDSLPLAVRDILANAQHAGVQYIGAPALPHDPTILRMLGNFDSAYLTPRDRWLRLPEQTRRMLANYQAAGGGRFVPSDQANHQAYARNFAIDVPALETQRQGFK